MKIYTKKGDTGDTRLVTGKVVKKCHARVIAYGAVDELNSYIGLLISNLIETKHTDNMQKTTLVNIQHRLFTIGSHLACDDPLPLVSPARISLPKLNETWVLELEEQIDKIQAELQPLKNFILPGGSTLSSLSHICRVTCRRAEALAVGVGCQNSIIIKFLNRLSDYLFTLARYFNKLEGVEDILWEK